MITAKCYKLEIKAHILISTDDKVEELITQSIFVYRGYSFGKDEIEKLEELAIQRITAKGPTSG